MTAEQPGEVPRPPRSRKPKATPASTPAKRSAPTPRGKVRDTRKKRAKKSAAPATRGRGRPPKVPTEDQIRHVQTMAMYGASHDYMAAMLDMSPPTFRKYLPDFFAPAIAKGKASGFMVSSRALFKAIGEGNMTAIIWNEKTRHGMTEKVHTVHSDPDGNALPLGGAAVTVGIFLPPNGRDVPAEGREIPAQFRVIEMPNNGREA
jgi:hypothetical protein